MDNLYISSKFCRSAWQSKQKIMACGVVRSDNRGMSKCIENPAATRKNEPINDSDFIASAFGPNSLGRHR